ncbi:MAG: hypothetical protein HC869_25670 [Rhodospirillales bacterium]|nr:hypothetical protein [Rhodospirillales bacterium]
MVWKSKSACSCYKWVVGRKKFNNLKLALSLLDDEVRGRVERALAKLSPDYSMTWVYRSPRTRELFPKSRRKDEGFERRLSEIYRVKGRHYDLRNATAGKNVVMLELIESYRDPHTAKTYRTPLVLVLECSRGKIRRGRHYCDPGLSHLELSERTVQKAFDP